MKLRKPDYYNDFQCIASACKDTCCAGWEIEIDQDTYEYYQKLDHPFKKELMKVIGKEEDETFFVLAPGKRCPLLNDNNLCRLILNVGEDALCDICREHPRHYQWFGDYTEVGIGLCCEEAGRLLFQKKEALTFIVEDDGEEEDDDKDPMQDALLMVRERQFALASDRSRGILERLEILTALSDALQPCMDVENAPAMSSTALSFTYLPDPEKCSLNLEYARSIVELYRSLESLDDTWPTLMDHIGEHLAELLGQYRDKLYADQDRVREYEHFLTYLIYRYQMGALFDGDVRSPMHFAKSAVCLLQLIDMWTIREKGVCTFEDRIQNAKLFSKEVEYCPENMELLWTKF